ncbi:hypothetical protein SNE40_017834 [Patella caerulea]|uniref:M-phase inducer phosphatase n=1 Tax=Patella caerulea TaxID=87958 RepID=A0AAN8JFS0_PATCE
MSDRTPIAKPLSLALKNISNNISFGESPATCTVNSPMTNLAFNLSGLSTGRGTPKRRLSLSSIIDTPTSEKPTPERMSSTESGCYMDSPTLEASPTFDQRKKTIAFRRINSLPLPSLSLDSPTDFLEKDADISPIERPQFDLDDTCSQDSGLGLDREKDEDFMFKAPSALPKRKMKIINEDTCSPHKYSPVKSPSKKRSFSVSFARESPEEKTQLLFGSPVRLKSSPLTSMEDDVDDGFLDVFDTDSLKGDSVSSTMASLFHAPVINKKIPEDDGTPILRRKASRSLLYRSQSFDVRSRTKRSPREDDGTPTQNKRHRFADFIEQTSLPAPSPTFENKMVVARRFQRCQSATEEVIKSAVNRMSNDVDLIGDCSKPYSLPIFTSGKHQDLKRITPETVCRVINNEFEDIESYRIIDCRYPYEYEGGHIKGGENIYTKDVILSEFLKCPKRSENVNKRHIIIFHCEFSSERGPNLLRFLRNKDRDCNKEDYPNLHYPELYLLDGGYKVFFEYNKEYCEPQSYKQMSDKDHLDDLKKFRAKSKSWNGDKSRSALRPLKF